MSGNYDYDLIAIGSGPAGIQAAIQASKLKKSVVIIEKSPVSIGGAWIHTGTLPSKTLRESLESIHNIRNHAGQIWVEKIISEISTSKLMLRARKVATEEEALMRRYLTKNKIEVKTGHATFLDPHTLSVQCELNGNFTVSAKNFVIATGSRPRRPSDVTFDGYRVVDSDELLRLTSLPKSIVIYGSGVIGCEYACIFGALGVPTTLVDLRDRLLQSLDYEVVKSLEKAMLDMGVVLKLSSKITDVQTTDKNVRMKISGQETEADVLFYAAGRVSNSDQLGLELIGVKISDKSAIEVNEFFQTAVEHIYAAGDVIGAPALASTSAQQGRFCSLHAFTTSKIPFPKVFPVGVYTIPELSSIGRTEDELNAANIPHVIGRAYYSEVARGYIRGDSVGLLKLMVCTLTHKIIGIHIVGDGAANLIHIGLAFMLKDGHVQDLVNMIFNYPTLAEAYRIAAFNALNKIFPDGNFLPPPQN